MSKDNPFAHNLKPDQIHEAVIKAAAGIGGVAEKLKERGMSAQQLDEINQGRAAGQGVQI